MSEAFAYEEPAAEVFDGPRDGVRWHPLANLFPLLEGEAYWALVEDIREHGVREPIVMLDGMVLDGRNRFLAARECHKPYPVVEFTGEDPAAYVVSLNLKRRHLSESQRATVATKLAKMPPGRPTSDKPANLPGFGEPHRGYGVTQAEAATLLNVSERSVRLAGVVLDHGTPELVAAVDAGAVTVSAAAEVARLPETVQAEIMEDGPEAVKEVAAELRQADTAGLPAEERAEMRRVISEAVIEGRRSGSPKANRKNPIHEPNPAFDAMANVVGACRTLVERIDAQGPAYIISGCTDHAMRLRNAGVFAEAHRALSQLMEACGD